MDVGIASARNVPCAQPRSWQTFAIGILPAGARTFDQPAVKANPTVSAVCSVRVMLASRRGPARRIAAGGWQVDVLPPNEAAFNSGARTYRCIANMIGTVSPATSQFGA